MKLAPVIGIETHIQLKTKSKLFCGCSNDSENASPNTHVCPICLGHPGVLPVPNKQAVEWSMLLGLALNGKISPKSKFDRKNYFYPDLPKAYQISQFDLPIMSQGKISFKIPGDEKKTTIRIERLHLEEDAAKNIHGEDGNTYVDYNRGGTPLCEIVSYPDFTNGAQVKAYMSAIRLISRTLGVSDGDMEKGHMRCDVNISLREVDDDGNPLSPELNPKTEIKNVNSFKAVEKTILHEIKRQTHLWEAGNPPSIITTRGWNDAKQVTEDQRIKEDSADYRYFPEPDIPPMFLKEWSEEVKNSMPELPDAKFKRFMSEFGFRESDARQIIDDPALAGFSEQAMSELGSWLQASPDITPEQMEDERAKLTKLFASWLLNKLMGLLIERKLGVDTMKISPENFAEFLILIANKTITSANGLKVLGMMLDDGVDPSHAVEELGAGRVDDANEIGSIIDKIIENNPEEVERYKNGEKQLTQWFIGQIMKESRGNADPAAAAQILNEKLG